MTSARIITVVAFLVAEVGQLLVWLGIGFAIGSDSLLSDLARVELLAIIPVAFLPCLIGSPRWLVIAGIGAMLVLGIGLADWVLLATENPPSLGNAIWGLAIVLLPAIMLGLAIAVTVRARGRAAERGSGESGGPRRSG